MSILEPRDYYKPFSYGWAFEAYLQQQTMHWLVSEVPLADDIADWNTKLTENERSLLTQLFRFFTQADCNVAQGYVERYLPRFPHPEVRMMLLSFAAMEAVHQHAYSALIDTLGLPDSEYRAFQDYAEMRAKHEFMFERPPTKNIGDLLLDIATFSAFGEGLQLFSSFAVLLSFQKRGLLKGTTTLTEYSLRDETVHVEGMVRLFHTLVQEHPRAWTDDAKKRIYETCRQMVKLEDNFIDLMFGVGDIEGITSKETKQYIRYIADRRLLQLGLKSNYHVKENPFPWLDWITNAPVHTNFFEQKSTEYGKGGIEGWSGAFDFLDRQPSTGYRVYTMPGCPHCERAVEVLQRKGQPFEAILIEDADERAKLKATQGGWLTFPMVFVLDTAGTEVRFLGGADSLVEELVNSGF